MHCGRTSGPRKGDTHSPRATLVVAAKTNTPLHTLPSLRFPSRDHQMERITEKRYLWSLHQTRQPNPDSPVCTFKRATRPILARREIEFQKEYKTQC